jgi:ankyrin repeat protein
MVRCRKSGVNMNTKALFIRFTTALFFMLIWSIPAFCSEIRDAARAGDLAKVSALLKEQPDLIASNDQTGFAPLHEAALYGRKDMVELLLAKGADITAKDKSGSTPLHLAAKGGYKDAVKSLLAHSADSNAKDNYGETPLRWAAQKGSKDAVELLLAYGAEANAKNSDSRTPLYYAVQKGFKDIVELLLANKAEVNVKTTVEHVYTNHGGGIVLTSWTPLHYAAREGNKDIVELLVNNGADVNAKLNDGTTPLKVAIVNRCNDVVEFLRQHGGHE